ncbi:MAG: YHS domain protein [Chitinophagaceae bacterium]|nr:YHS domain protein [Chitinophagaceae bacterium]
MNKNSLLAIGMILFLQTSNAIAQGDTRKKQFNITKAALAIDGYDPVAYFTSNKAVQGRKDVIHNHQGITYRFARAQNRQLFIADPIRFEPQYGGWCAYAMGSSGEKVEIDPETFKIINGKLYLFYNSFFNNTLKSWNKNEVTLKKNADANWVKIYQ